MIAKPENPARDAARTQLKQGKLAIDQQYPQPRASFEDFIAQLRHCIEIAGIEHVGIGIDFDGGGGVTGLDQASDYPRISARLLQLGMSRDALRKL